MKVKEWLFSFSKKQQPVRNVREIVLITIHNRASRLPAIRDIYLERSDMLADSISAKISLDLPREELITAIEREMKGAEFALCEEVGAFDYVPMGA